LKPEENSPKLVSTNAEREEDQEVFTVVSTGSGLAARRYFINFNRSSITVSGRRFELSDAERLPSPRGKRQHVAIRGTLRLKNDVTVFRYEAEKPFGEGLPVPEGYSLEESRQRYVLEDVTWEIIKGR